MNCRRTTALVTGLTFLIGVVLISSHFDPNSAWYYLGLTVVVMAGMAGVCWYFAGKRANLDDAFEAGYQAGFYRGERVKPKVIRLPIERHREPSLRR
jgi:hypothetical protein